MDAGLAKVINSTVGTSSFKPLDKLLYGRQGLVPSENVYFKIGTFDEKTATVKVVQGGGKPEVYSEPVLSMKMWTDGGIAVGTKVVYGHTYSGLASVDITSGIGVFVNGTLVKKATYPHISSSMSPSSSASVMSEGVYFKTGDVVEIKAYVSGSYDSDNKGLDIFCKVSPTNPIVIYADSVEKPFDITYAE